MTRIDQFESVFRSAERTVFTHQTVKVGKVLLLTDLEDSAATEFASKARRFLRVLGEEAEWCETNSVGAVGEMLDLVTAEKPDLVCTYRNLHSEAWQWPFSLGEFLDVLTQATPVPVLVLPRPEQKAFWHREDLETNSVLALTDHLTGDARLVNHAVRFTEASGSLCLVHIEDERIFERYVSEVIGKIPEIDTDVSRHEIAKQLLKEPTDYIVSCKQVLRQAGLSFKLSKVVEFGHHLAEVERILEEKKVTLVVLNTKDKDQLAMHGLAYPLAVELRSTPLLML
jgi:hypothetical protein